MDRGWIKLWRKSNDKGWIKNHKLWALWSWALLKASHKEKWVMVGNQEIKLYPGQFIFGRRAAAKETGLSEQEIRSRLDFLRDAQNLTIKSTNKFSIITIINWDTYQSDERQNNHQINQQITTKQPQTRMYKNDKNENTSCSDSKKTKSKRTNISFSNEDLKFAELFEDLLLANNPKRKSTTKSQIKSWANEVRLMRERDGRIH